MKLPLLLAEACVATAEFSESSLVYILRLRSGQLYIGSSTDLRQRLVDHSSGRVCRTTALDPPVAVLHLEAFDSFADARRREAQLKRWSRTKKEALILGKIKELHILACSRDRQG